MALTGHQMANPFPGLRSFEPEEDYLFFGRDRQIDELVRRLRVHRFVTVLGTSGSGKSSLVRAGLIPSLYGGSMAGAGSGWRVAIFRPEEDPLGNLARALAAPGVLGDARSANPDLDRAFLAATLRTSGLGLAVCARQARLAPSEKLLVVVDQFEELFRFKERRLSGAAREEALAFVRLLLEASRAPECPVYVALTLRSDFLGRCMEFPDLPEAINEGLYLVPRLRREELRAAIRGPVAVSGAEISDPLVVRLLNEIGDKEDQLPILQHALMRTWDLWHRDPAGGPLGLSHYEATGTMSRALDRHAEEAYEEIETLPQGSRIAATLFRALTEQEPDGKGVRRPVLLSEILELTGAEEAEVAAVVDRFRAPGRTFLMPPGAEGGLDLSHESLMRIWERLARWVEAEGLSARTYLDLAGRAARHEKGEAALLRGPELQIALDWRQREAPSAAWARRYSPGFERAIRYLDASEEDRRKEVARQDEARRRQLRLTRWLAFVLGAVALLILGFFLYARSQNRELAEKTEQLEKSREELTQNQDELRLKNVELRKTVKDLSTKTSEAESATKMAEKATEQAHQQAENAKAKEAEVKEQKDQIDKALKVARSERDAKEAQIRLTVKEIKLKEVERVRAQAAELKAQGQRLLAVARELALRPLGTQEPAVAALLKVQAFRFNRGNGGQQEQADINMALREALRGIGQPDTVVKPHEDAVRVLSVAPDGSLYSGGEDGRIVRLPGFGTRAAVVLREGGASVRSLALSPSGRTLAAGGLDGSVWLWDATNGRSWSLARPLDGAGPVVGLAFLSVGPEEHLIAARQRGGLSLWTVAGQLVRSLPAVPPDRAISSLAVQRERNLVAVGTPGGTFLWTLAESPAPSQLACSGLTVRAVAFGPAGDLACGTATGEIRVERSGSPAETLAGHASHSAVNALSFSPDGRFLASAGADRTVRLWWRSGSGAGASRAIELGGHSGWVWAVAFSSDGRRLASGSEDRTLRLWTPLAEDMARELCARLHDRDLNASEWQMSLPGLDYEKTCSSPW